MSQKINHVVIVLDSSGSMEQLKNEVVTGLNEQLNDIEKASAEENQLTSVTLVTFGSKVSEPRLLQPGERLKVGDYKPSGWTRLNDAVGLSIQCLQQVPKNPGDDIAFLVIIVTDGHENASTQFTSEQIATVIDTLKREGNWTFTFMGATEDTFAVGQRYKISAGNVMKFSPDSVGVLDMTAANSTGFKKFATCRAAGQSNSVSFYNG